MCFTSHILLLFSSSYTEMRDSLLYSLLLYTYNNNIKLLHWSIYKLRLYIYFICDVKKYIDIKILTFTNITFILSSKYCRIFYSPKNQNKKNTHTKQFDDGWKNFWFYRFKYTDPCDLPICTLCSLTAVCVVVVVFFSFFFFLNERQKYTFHVHTCWYSTEGPRRISTAE